MHKKYPGLVRSCGLLAMALQTSNFPQSDLSAASIELKMGSKSVRGSMSAADRLLLSLSPVYL